MQQKHPDAWIIRTSPIHGRPQEFFQRGANPRGLAKVTYFSTRWRRERKFSRFLRRFRLNLRVFDSRAEGASENFGIFCTATAYDVIIFKFQGGCNCPRLPPLRALMRHTNNNWRHMYMKFSLLPCTTAQSSAPQVEPQDQATLLFAFNITECHQTLSNSVDR